MKPFGSSSLLWSGALLYLVLAQPVQAQVNITEWTGGTGTVYENRWTNGQPGQFTSATNEHLSLSQYTGPYYGHTLVRVNSGGVTFSPSVATAYNVTGVPDERYSTTALVNYLAMPDMIIGDTGTGSLSMKNGFRLLAERITLGATATGAGMLDIDGLPAAGAPVLYPENVNSIENVIVGAGGIGRLNLKNGATFDYCDNYYPTTLPNDTVIWNKWQLLAGNQSGSNGFITVSGAGSRLKYEVAYFSDFENGRAGGTMLGLSGTGGLTLEAGGSMLSRAGRLGVLAGGSGFSSVTGTGSRWDIDAQLWVGERSAGSMLISNGGLVRSGFGPFYKGTVVDTVNPDVSADDYGSIGKYAGSNGSVVVNGSASRWEHNANLIVGESGIGSLSIEGGTVVSNYRANGPTFDYADVANATIGLNGGSTGSVKVSGAGGRWQNGAGLVIGDQGSGKLTVASGGTVDVANLAGTRMAVGAASTGLLIFGGDDNAGVGTLGGSLVEGGAGTATVQFKHSGTYTPTHYFRNIDVIENTGPGTTILSSPIQDIGMIRATKGELQLSGANAASGLKSVVVNGGNLTLNGIDVVLPSTTLADGAVSNGNLKLTNGAKLTGTLLFSGSGGGMATITVDGAGSQFTPRKPPLGNNFIIGEQGAAQLVLQNSGKTIVDPATIYSTLGYGANGSALVKITGLGSELSAGGTTIGRAGNGNVYLDTFGLLSTTNGLIGELAGSNSSVTVASYANWRIADNALTLGAAGAGRLTISGNGSVRVGPTGAGVVTMGSQNGGSGIIQIGEGFSPGNLFASKIASGPFGVPEIRFYHNSADYEFPASIGKVDIQVVDGNKGTTTLTAESIITGQINITTGGLRVNGRDHSSTLTVDGGWLTVGDERTESMDPAPEPFFELSGEAYVNADAVVVGKEGSGELRLNGQSILTVGRPSALGELNLGASGGRGTLIFGGGPNVFPGETVCAGIRGFAGSGSKVIFDHSYNRFGTSDSILGDITIEHKNGTSNLSGTLSHTGPTNVTGGTLRVFKSINSLVTVSGTGSIGGTGQINRLNLQSGGAISPGGDEFSPIGTQRVGIFNVAAGAKFRIDLGPNLTCDQILNNSTQGVYLDMAFNPPATGNINFEFRNAGINQNGVYPIFRPYTQLSADLLSRLRFTSNFPLQGYFQQTYFNGGIGNRYYQVEFVTTSFAAADYDTWATTGYGLDLASNGLPTADPDKDGLNNMLEYILGSSPVSGQMTRLPQMTVSGSNAVFTFLRRKSAETVFPTTVQWSTDLAQWTDLSASAVTSISSTVANYDAVTATLPIPPNSPKFFARLKVTQITP